MAEETVWVKEYPAEEVTWYEEQHVMSTETAICISFGVVVMAILFFSLFQFIPFPVSSRGFANHKADDATSKHSGKDDSAVLRPSFGRCKDEGCAEAVSKLRRSINEKVNPCDDFYRFACGNFNDPSRHALDQMTEEMYNHVQKALEHLNVPKYSQRAVEKAAGLYQACRSVREYGVDESASLRSFMDGAGLFLSNKKEGEALEKIVRLGFQYNINAVIKIEVEDYESAAKGMQIKVAVDTNHVDWISKRVHLGCDHSIEFYKRHVIAYGLREDSKERTELIKEIIDAENKALGWLPDDRISCLLTFINVPVTALNTYSSNIRSDKWTVLLVNQSAGVLRPEQQVIVSPCALEYFNYLYGGIQNDGVNLLVAWEVLRLLAPLSYPGVASLYEESSAKRLCLAAVMRVMEVPALSTYLFKAVPLEAVGVANSLLKNIRQTALIKVDSANWIQGPSKSSATQKLSSMQPEIGYPEFLSSQDALNQQYVMYPRTGCSFLETWVEASRLTAKNLLKENFGYNLHMNAPLVVYVPTLNKMRIRAPILRPPVFLLGGPSCLNYGGLGHLVSHEMMHAFDLTGGPKGSTFGEGYWWTDVAGRNYTDRVLCIREKHDQLVQRRGGQPSDLEDSENMADFIGIWLAYETFKNLGDKTRFPDLPYDAKQLFFIASCVKLCSKTAVHTTNRLSSMRARCNVPLMNFPEFAEAFNCSRGTAMNPSRRCELWESPFCSRH